MSYVRGEAKDSETRSYQIELQGHLDTQWTRWFEGFTITLKDSGETMLTGPIADQAELFGVLRRVRDLGMPLLSLNRIAANGAASLATHTPTESI